MMKLTTRCGPTAVEGLNEALLAKAAAAKLLRTNRVRVDTTVVPSNVSYPTDSGLLAKAITRIAATQRRILAGGGATRTMVGDRPRAAGKRAHSIGAKLRTRSAAGKDEAQAAVRRVTSELADLAQASPRTPTGSWPTPSRHCGGPARRPRTVPPTASVTRLRDDVAAGLPAPSMT